MAVATLVLRSTPRERLARLAGELRQPDIVAWTFWLLAAWWLAFATLVLRAWVHAGVWPHGRSGNPISGNLRDASVTPQVFELHYLVLGVLSLLAFYIVPFATAVFLVRLPSARRRPSPELLLGFSALVLSAGVLVVFDLGGLFTWFVD